jgi:protein-tyrosine phosphatase
MTMKSELPTDFSYKVTDYFYAGEYPFTALKKDGLKKLKSLIDFGIKHFIDLTSEPLTQYNEHLPVHCTYTNFSTDDYTVPDFSVLQEIHTKIAEAERDGEKIYVHCKGGHDRTGVVVATYFIHAGLSPSEAKKKFREVFVPPVRGRYPHRPLIETDWKVLDRYRKWLTENMTTETTQVEINHNAVKVLWEGIVNQNPGQVFRRVLYLPYVDGYNMLLVTEADGTTVTSIRAEEISKQFFPEKYYDDLPDEYKRLPVVDDR